jgi:serine/threonine protein kinase/Tol biopolymer transport system component
MIRAVTGTTVGHYEILEKLGEGGMGLVYRARDVLLDRTAALKFLPADSAAADDKRRRFVKEAQAASSLNHPNIITIYEVGQADGRDFIAMELVQGRPLDEVIGRKALPLGTSIAYGIQIADALAAAHAAGIVHRDLKPGNVMIADSGVVKVLDFGLAKLVAPASSAPDATRTMLDENPRTVDGTILGTVSYMSPEQAEGKPVDPRSDIFSFGALCYEMLTGRRAFQRESTACTLAAILTADPVSLSSAALELPTELARIVSRCLRKAPEKRWQSIADVRIALEEFKQDLESGRIAGDRVPVPAPRRSWMAIGAAALIAAAVTGFAVWHVRPSVSSPELWGVRRLTADAGASMSPTISQDGKLVAYVSDRAGADSMDLWVQQIDGGDPVQLTRGLDSCQDPAFSPDGGRIVLRCGTEPDSLYVVPTFGGLPKKIAEGAWPKFSPDGSRIAYVGHSTPLGSEPVSGVAGSRSLWIVSADGTQPKEIKTGKGMFNGPVWRPDGKGLLFIGFSDPDRAPDDRDWYFVPADGGALIPTGAIARLRAGRFGFNTALSVTSNGVLFHNGDFDSTNIYRMPFDAAFQKVSGDPIPVIVGAGFNFTPTASQDGRRIAFAIAKDVSTNIWRAPVDSTTGKVAGEPVRITSGLNPSLGPSPSRDGKRLAYLGGPSKTPEVRIRDIAAGTDVRLAEAKPWSSVVLSPDGSTVAFHSDHRENSPIYSVSAAGGVPKKICRSCGRPIEWFPDRTKLLFDSGGPQRREIYLLDVATGEQKPLLQHADRPLSTPRLSPDGRSLLFTLQRPARARRLYVAPFSGELVPEKEWTLLIDGSNYERQPFWAPSGNLIYFLSERDGFRCIWAQRVDIATRQAIGAPFAAQHMHQTRYSLEPIPDVASIGLSVAGGQLFYASFELQSNIWLAERREPDRK